MFGVDFHATSELIQMEGFEIFHFTAINLHRPLATDSQRNGVETQIRLFIPTEHWAHRIFMADSA